MCPFPGMFRLRFAALNMTYGKQRTTVYNWSSRIQSTTPTKQALPALNMTFPNRRATAFARTDFQSAAIERSPRCSRTARNEMTHFVILSHFRRGVACPGIPRRDGIPDTRLVNAALYFARRNKQLNFEKHCNANNCKPQSTLHTNRRKQALPALNMAYGKQRTTVYNWSSRTQSTKPTKQVLQRCE